MANDGGLIATLEQWMVTTLAALTNNGKAVFKTVEVWKHQVSAAKGGLEKFSHYEPFAFVGYMSTDTAREGGYDLREVFEFGILIGVQSRSDGVARFGNSNNLGTSKIHDLVITAFDRKHPGGSLTCDDFYFTGAIEVIDAPKHHAIEMHFETSQLITN